MNKVAELAPQLERTHGATREIEALGRNIWLVNGPEVPYLGLSLPTRMTLIRIKGQLWVHSPIPLTDSIKEFIRTIGQPAYIVAPNKLHHLHLRSWHFQYPNATLFAPPGLRKKRKDITFDFEILPDRRYQWSDDIHHDHFKGNLFMDELVFFHRSSRTLILTDLILNLKTDHFNWRQKLLAQFDQIRYPNGRTPRLYRYSMYTKSHAKKSYQQFLEWDPINVVINHGACIRGNGKQEIEARLGWLKN